MAEIHQWSRLGSLQLGRYAEYYAKMEFALHGFDVYTAEVDTKGIDVVIRKDANRYYDVQVKSARNFNYIFLPKDKFVLRPNLLAVVALFVEGELPSLYLFPSMAWLTPSALLVSYESKDEKSKPEWGLNFAKRNRELLATFAFENKVSEL